jgi:hypothetical protein
VNQIEPSRRQAHLAIAATHLALHHDLERAANGHERDIERCEMPQRGI